jgi:DNA repair protein RecN (Recombination protein N)
VEIHGQGAGFALASASNQLAALDALAGSKDVLASYRDALGRAREMEAELERMSSASRERAREADYLRFQVEEIDSAGLSPDEEETLPVEIARLEHAERLVAAGAEASELTGSDGAAGRLAEAHKLIEDAVRIDPSLGALGQRVGALAAEAAEAAWDMRAWVEDLDPDPARLEVLRERAAAIGALKRKYGDTVAEVLAAAEQARVRLGELDSTAERGALLEASLAEAWTETEQRGAELSGLRGEAAVRLTELVNAELPDLALPGGLFHAVCEPADTFLQTGRDRVEFRFTADRSRPPDLLGKVASGGELSRAMIAVTLALAAAHPVGVLVFDEADAGVGGRAALELGRRLARLGTTHQVLVVTHLPQIAAMASHHVRVTKAGGTVAVEALAPPGRLEEVSRMLAGVTSSEAARAHAAELLEMGRERPGRRRAS